MRITRNFLEWVGKTGIKRNNCEFVKMWESKNFTAQINRQLLIFKQTNLRLINFYYMTYSAYHNTVHSFFKSKKYHS